MDGWMMGQDDEPLFWVPVENRLPKSQQSWACLTQGSAESGRNVSTKDVKRARVKGDGGRKPAGVAK